MRGFSFFGTSRWIMPSSSHQKRALEDADRAQLPIPELDGMLLDEAVAAEQLHALRTDLHRLLRALHARERRLAPERLAALRATCRAVHHQPHAIELERDVRDRKGDRLAMHD